MKAVFSVRGAFRVAALALLVLPLGQIAVAESVEDRFSSILYRPGELEAVDAAFLQSHSKELARFGETLVEKLCLGRQQAPERTQLARLIQMLGAARDVATAKLQEEIVEKLVAIGARSDTATGEALCRVLIQADDFSLARTGIEQCAARYPHFLVEALDKDKVRTLYREEAIIHLARNGVKDALPILSRIAEQAPDSRLRAVSGVAIAKIEGKRPPDRFDKSTPEKFARSFIALVKEHSDRFTEEDLEFWGNPMFEPCVTLWNEYLASILDHKKNRELTKRLETARLLGQALKEGDGSFVVNGHECVVSVEGEEVRRLYRDMFGEWRFRKMP